MKRTAEHRQTYRMHPPLNGLGQCLLGSTRVSTMDVVPPPSPDLRPGSAPEPRRALGRLVGDFLQNKARVLEGVSVDSTEAPPAPGVVVTVIAGAGAVGGGVAGFVYGLVTGGISNALLIVPFGVLLGGALFGLTAVVIFVLAASAWEMVAFPMR